MIRQGRLFLIALVILSGCGNKKDKDGPIKWTSFPVAFYADQDIVSDSNSNADLREAMSFWEQRAGRQLFDFRGAWKGSQPYSGGIGAPESIFANVLFYQYSWPFASNVMGKTVVISSDREIQGSVIMINPEAGFCTNDCIGFSGAPSSRNVFAHELGHFLGLGHDNNPSNIMYPTLLGGSLSNTQVDQGSLAQLTN